MSNVEDTRTVIQDFVAPDLKALAARLEALEKEMKIRFDHIDARFEQADKASLERFSAAEKVAAARHETNLVNHANVMNAIAMEKRLARLENELGRSDERQAS